MSFLRWCEQCRAKGIQSPVCQFRVTATAVVEMCKRLECFDLMPQISKQCSVQEDFPNCSKQAVTLKERHALRPPTSSVPGAPINFCRPCKTRNTHAVEGALSSSTKEPSVYACDSASALSLSAIFGQKMIQDKKRKTKFSAVKDVPSSVTREPPLSVSDSTPTATLNVFSGQETFRDINRNETSHAVEVMPSSSTKEPPVCVFDSTSSEPLSTISRQEVVQDKNRKKTSHAFDVTPSSSTKENPVYVSDSTSSESLSTISRQEVVQDKNRKKTSHAFDVTPSSSTKEHPVYVSDSTSSESLSIISRQEVLQDKNEKETSHVVQGIPSSSAKEPPVYVSDSTSALSLNAISQQDKSKKEANCASNMGQLGKALTEKRASWSVTGRTWTAAVVLAVPGESATGESDFVSASLSSRVALPTAPQKKEMATQTIENYNPSALKPLGCVFGLPDRSQVDLSQNIMRAGVATAVEPPRCCQKVEVANQAFENNNAAVVKPTTDIPRLPENGEVGLQENLAVSGRTSFISPPTLPQEEKAIHHTVSDHYHAVEEHMSYLEGNEGDVPESFKVVIGTSSSELVCPRETQAGSSTVGSLTDTFEEPASGLPQEDEVGLQQSSMVTSETSSIRHPILEQEEEAGHQTTAAEPASSHCLLPDRSEGGAPVSFMGLVGRSSPEFPKCSREQQDNFENVESRSPAVESHSPAVEKPISDFSDVQNKDEVGSRQSADVAGKLSSIRLPTLPQQDGDGHQIASDHGRASHISCLPDKSDGSAPECFTTVSDTLSLGPPTCLQEKKAGFKNLGRRTAAVEKLARDLRGFPDRDEIGLRRSPAVASESSPVNLATPSQKEQETSEYSTYSNISILTKHCSDVQDLPRESDLPGNVAVESGLSSLEPPGPSANHVHGVVKSVNIPFCVPDANELDLQGNLAVASEPSLVGSPKSQPKRLEDSQKKASYVSASVGDYISEESLSVGGEVSLQEKSEVNSKTSLDTPKTLQKEQGGNENTFDHHCAVGIPCHTNQLPNLSSSSVVSVLGPAEDSLSATLRIAESTSKLENSQRKAGYADSAPTASCNNEASLPIRGEVSLPENFTVNSNTPSAETPRTLQIELGGTNTNQVPSLPSTSEVSLLVSDEDSLSATLHIAETMSKLATDRPRKTPSTIGSLQQIIPPSAAAVTVKQSADVRGTVGMAAHSGKGRGRGEVTELMPIPFMHLSSSGETVWGGGSGNVVPTTVAAPLVGVLNGSDSQAGLGNSNRVNGQAVVLTAARIVGGARKVEHIIVTLPSSSTVTGRTSQAVQSTNTRAGGLKRPHSSASSENEGLSGDAPSRLDSRTKLAIMKKLCPEDRSRPVGQTSSGTKGAARASKPAESSMSPMQVGPACKRKQVATRSRQPAAARNRQPAVPRAGRKQVSGAQRKGKLQSKHPEHVVPDVLHPVPSPLSSEFSSASSKPSNDGSSGHSDNRSGPYLSSKFRSTKNSAAQSSSSSASERAKFMEAIQNRILQATTSASRLPGYHSALASRPLYRDEVPVITSKRRRTVDKGAGNVDVDLDRYIAELSTTKDLEQYDSVLSGLFDSCT